MKAVVWMMLAIVLLSACDGNNKAAEKPSWPEVVNAYKLCDVFTQSGASSCKVEDALRTLDVSINTSKAEAKKICKEIPRKVKQYELFEEPWTIKIKMVDSDDILATCKVA